MNYTLSRILGWIAENKMITFLSICLFSFVIATIVLSAQKSNLEDDLSTCREKLKNETKLPGGGSGGNNGTSGGESSTGGNNGVKETSDKTVDIPKDGPKDEPTTGSNNGKKSR